MATAVFAEVAVLLLAVSGTAGSVRVYAWLFSLILIGATMFGRSGAIANQPLRFADMTKPAPKGLARIGSQLDRYLWIPLSSAPDGLRLLAAATIMIGSCAIGIVASASVGSALGLDFSHLLCRVLLVVPTGFGWLLVLRKIPFARVQQAVDEPIGGG